VRSWSEPVAAPAAVSWALLAQPGLWSRWSPHLRGAWRLGDPEVEEGQAGFARLLGAVPVPVRVTQVTPGASWTWRAGPMSLRHLAEREGEGSRVTIEMQAPGPLERVLAGTYGRAFPSLLRRLAAEAEGRS
jgi:hypothetical protein